jgi:hypothetical protein
VRHARGRVTLMNLDGKTVDVKLSALSEADKAYVQQKITEIAPPKQKTK